MTTNKYREFIKNEELTDVGLDYAIDSHDKGSPPLPRDMPIDVQGLIQEAWSVMDTGLLPPQKMTSNRKDQSPTSYGLPMESSPEFVQGYLDIMASKKAYQEMLQRRKELEEQLGVNRTDSYLQGYLDVMENRFDRKGEGVACGRGWISRRKKCGRDKSRITSPEAKARTVEKQKVRQQLRGQVKAAKGQKPYVKPKPEPDIPQKYPTRLPKDHVVTTNKRITAARIDKALNAIDSPGAKERVGMFRAFVAKTGVQSVFADPSASLTDHLDVVERGLKDKRYASQDGGLLRNTKADPTAAGYTTFLWNHVVITSDSRGRDGPFAASSEKLKQSADRIFEANAEDELIRDVTTFPSSVSGSVRDRDSRELMTYIHEVGHQVHAKAGVPPVPMTIKGSATNYGAVNEEEWFAEHFALWMLDAPRYEQLDPAGAQFIRDSLTKATESPVSVEELMARGKV